MQAYCFRFYFLFVTVIIFAEMVYPSKPGVEVDGKGSLGDQSWRFDAGMRLSPRVACHRLNTGKKLSLRVTCRRSDAGGRLELRSTCWRLHVGRRRSPRVTARWRQTDAVGQAQSSSELSRRSSAFRGQGGGAGAANEKAVSWCKCHRLCLETESGSELTSRSLTFQFRTCSKNSWRSASRSVSWNRSPVCLCRRRGASWWKYHRLCFETESSGELTRRSSTCQF